MDSYLEDIYSQPKELRSFLQHYQREDLLNALRELGKSSYRKVIFSGMGSSHFCSLTANILLKQAGIDSEVISAGELYYYEWETIQSDCLLCLISQSGESGEIIHIVKKLPTDITVVAVTNHPDSTLGKRSDYLFPLFVSDEISVTTRTYLASCAVTLLISSALKNVPIEKTMDELKTVFFNMEEYLSKIGDQVDRWADFVAPMTSVSVIGRGFSLPSVRAGSLFFRETARFPAIDFDGAEFRHGPMEMVDGNFYAIVFAPGGSTGQLSIKLARDIGEKGGHVLLITNQEDEEIIRGVMKVHIPEASPMALMFYEILPLQLLANTLAQHRGIVAGQFRWGSKITKEG